VDRHGTDRVIKRAGHGLEIGTGVDASEDLTGDNVKLCLGEGGEHRDVRC
jgi:hypothetical protein